MGPRSFRPRNKTELLQWGRDQTAESRLLRRFNGAAVFQTAESLRTGDENRAPAPSFNGAAVFQTAEFPPHRFNGAAVFQTAEWAVGLSGTFLSFNGAAVFQTAESSRAQSGKIGKTASMGPRLFRPRNPGSLAFEIFGAGTLQWGRGLSDRGIRPEIWPLQRFRSFNKASMGLRSFRPRIFRLSSRHVSFRSGFNGAAVFQTAEYHSSHPLVAT